MLKKIAGHIAEGNTYQGLEVYDLNGNEHFSLLKLKRQKGELEVVTETTSEKLNDLLLLIEKRAPLYLAINTGKVLKKQVEIKSKNNPELLVVTAFPNLELDNFYYEVLISEDSALVCISKKEYIEQYLGQLKKLGLVPFSICIGISQIGNLSAFVNGELIGSNYTITFAEKAFSSYTPVQNVEHHKIQVNGLKLNNSSLLSFTQILGHIQKISGSSSLNNLNGIFSKGFKNNRIFDFGLKASLGFFLILLLGNFLVFSHYTKKNGLLETRLASEQLQGNSIQQLQKRVSLKEERLKILTNSKNSKTTFYFDELGKNLPSSIYLNDIQYQPLLTPVRKGKQIELKKNNLQISGITKDKIAFTVWSDNLEMQNWVDKVEIMDYEYISKSSADFTINIVVNELK